tara:strand:+ start:1679 stop:2326 length:648 start_codon:yes stop_codon:yes gene_type:complete
MTGHNRSYYDITRNMSYKAGKEREREIEMSIPDGLEFNKQYTLDELKYFKRYSLDEIADKAMFGSQADVFGVHTNKKEEMPKINYEEEVTPNYYIGNVYGYEAVDIIEDFNLSYNVGNVVSYLLRAGKKYEEGMTDLDKHVEDLIKAKNHIDFEIKQLRNKQIRKKHDETIARNKVVPNRVPPLPNGSVYLDQKSQPLPFSVDGVNVPCSTCGKK